MTHEVFICHASRDKPVAEAVCATLESRHIRCWIAPRDVLPGTEWAEAIVDALDGSRIVVLVLSSSSNSSPQVIREVGRAASNDTPIVPLRIDNVPPSKAMGFFVSSHQWLDAQTPPLKKHLQRLADIVQQLLTQERVPQKSIDMPEKKDKPVVSVERPVEAARPVQQVSHCPECGTELRPNATFCNKCGARASKGEKEKPAVSVERPVETAKSVQQVPHCPECGIELRPDASFCNKCGTRVSEGEKDK